MLETGVYLIKPNIGELAKLIGVERLEMNEVAAAAQKLINNNTNSTTTVNQNQGITTTTTNATNQAVYDVTKTILDTIGQIITNSIDLNPVIRIPQGTKVTVIVNSDIKKDDLYCLV